MKDEMIEEIKERSFKAFEQGMKTGTAIHRCPSCNAEREIKLETGVRAYHWQRGKVVHLCSDCVKSKLDDFKR